MIYPKQTRHRFCLYCRANKIFEHVYHIDWCCTSCGAKRSFTIDPVSESTRGGDFGRFWSNVKITPYCWNWMGKASRSPQFWLNGVAIRIARVAFYLYCGKWPTGIALRRCKNILCVKPDHMIDVPNDKIRKTMSMLGHLKNLKRPLLKKCRRGHRLNGYNVYVQKAGRTCRKCMYEAHTEWKRKKAECTIGVSGGLS